MITKERCMAIVPKTQTALNFLLEMVSALSPKDGKVKMVLLAFTVLYELYVIMSQIDHISNDSFKSLVTSKRY